MGGMLSPGQVRAARLAAGLTQAQAARRLGVSQAYLALMESGRRRVTGRLGRMIARLYGLGPVAFPVSTKGVGRWDSSTLAKAIGSLGYPGFRQLAGRPRHNPAAVLLAAIASNELETRVVEALPWLAVRYSDLDWDWLVREAKIRDLQNRLGFVVTLARQVAESAGRQEAAERLGATEKVLERARLVREDTLCQERLSGAERKWLKQTRPVEARHWRLLTDVRAAGLAYAA